MKNVRIFIALPMRTCNPSAKFRDRRSDQITRTHKGQLGATRRQRKHRSMTLVRQHIREDPGKGREQEQSSYANGIYLMELKVSCTRHYFVKGLSSASKETAFRFTDILRDSSSNLAAKGCQIDVDVFFCRQKFDKKRGEGWE